MTRDQDIYKEKEDRTAFANNVKADVFLSIHANSYRGNGVRGAETFFLSDRATDDDARRLAAIENNLPALLDFPVDADLQPFRRSALFVRGAQSDYVLPEDETVIRALFPHARFVTIEGAGHWLHAEQPARFLAALDGL